MRAQNWLMAVAILLAMPCTPAGAYTQQQLDWCNGEGGATPDLKISGCTAAIQSGKFSGKNLATAFFNRGIAYYDKKDYDRAIADSSQAIRLNPKHAAAFNSRCWVRAAAGQELDQAIEDCDASLRLRPDDANTLNSRGFVYFRRGDNDKAMADYNAVLKHSPEEADSLYMRGIIRQRNGDSAGGAADIAAAKAIYPSIAEIYAGFGVK